MRDRKLKVRRAWGHGAYGVSPVVKMPTTVREWELFSTMKGCSVAARALTRGLSAAIADLERTMRPTDSYEDTRRKYVAAFKKHFQPAAYAHARCGASDTEPYGKGAGRLATAAAILAGREDDRDRLAWEV